MVEIIACRRDGDRIEILQSRLERVFFSALPAHFQACGAYRSNVGKPV
jgi:hypothetical protein